MKQTNKPSQFFHVLFQTSNDHILETNSNVCAISSDNFESSREINNAEWYHLCCTISRANMTDVTTKVVWIQVRKDTLHVLFICKTFHRFFSVSKFYFCANQNTALQRMSQSDRWSCVVLMIAISKSYIPERQLLGQIFEIDQLSQSFQINGGDL